jgi:hypothetical protein
MKRTAGWLLTLAAGSALASGCMATDSMMMNRGPYGHGYGPTPFGPPPAMNAVGPFGEPLMNQNQAQGMSPAMMSSAAASGIIPASFMPGGPCMPPAMGVPGGGPGCAPGGAGGASQGAMRSQVRFVGPAGAHLGWYVSADFGATMSSHQLDLPGRFNFLQASIYRLKLSNINGRPGLELYPTIEVLPSNAKTDAFLAHNYIPVEFTEEDFDQVTAGNYITKVIYLPDPQLHGSGTGGPEELTSTRLDPGVDPIAEAQRRGHILLIVRIGGIDLEARNTPGMTESGAAPPMMPQMQQVPQTPASHRPERGIINDLGARGGNPGFPQTAIPAPADLDYRPKPARKAIFGD